MLADVRHRLSHLTGRRKNWDAFFAAAPEDPAHGEGISLAERLATDHDVVFLTGRPERCRRDTEEWLERHGLGGHELLMRPDDDRRPAATLKVELLERLATGREVAVVVDDDARVVEAMRSAGHEVVHADWEERDARRNRALSEAQEEQGRT